jgi:uncharacterized protein YndB with AHSA1/START domain
MANRLQIAARGDREIVMTRAFDAPRELVFEAWTRPELVRRWLGAIPDWRMDVCEIDLRVGGSYRFVWRGPGQEMGMGGVYREIAVPERIVSTETFDDPWYAGEAVGTVTFEELDGQTVLTQVMRYDSPETRDGVLASPMESGVTASYDQLEQVLATLSIPVAETRG